jgi:regulator of PEP synthase PpsR (kinase-PPPase family)
LLALLHLSRHLETSHRVGAQHVLNAEYFKRIDALNYTMLHDDGQHVDGLEEADVVLVGLSRTSKTPTSIYLANRGVKTGNVPLVPGVAVSHHVEELKRPLVVGLYASPERIVQIRQNRLLGLQRTSGRCSTVDPQVGGRRNCGLEEISARATTGPAST